ncbi:MAG: winged helix-turn-helix domain-containing protein [Candidatus Hodarchaeota archaeon]
MDYSWNHKIHLVYSDLSSDSHGGGVVLTNPETNTDTNNDVPEPSAIDKFIHEPSRLIILSHLYTVENADLIFFKRKTNLSWGNLSSHATKLENAGYIRIEKIFRGKKPATVLEITEQGRRAFENYKKIIMNVFQD